MNRSSVSKTAIVTLAGRAVESESREPIIKDPMSVLSLVRMLTVATGEEKKWILKVKRLYEGHQAIHRKALAKRVKIFDETANTFIADHPSCTVVNLACGFDTRFWRINSGGCRFIEIDFPEVIAQKKEILKDKIDYELIGSSVTDSAWIDSVASKGSSHFLFLAEGLFMYLQKQDSIKIFELLAKRFTQSKIVLDTMPEKYSRGLWKKLIAFDSKLTWGLENTYVSGFDDPYEIESYGAGLRVSKVVKPGFGLGAVVSVDINPK